jgi:hypothetical protein
MLRPLGSTSTTVTFGGPPGSRSRHLGIKRNFPTVAVCRSRCACRLFSRNRVVLCRSRLVVLRKYEACSARWRRLRTTHPRCLEDSTCHRFGRAPSVWHGRDRILARGKQSAKCKVHRSSPVRSTTLTLWNFRNSRTSWEASSMLPLRWPMDRSTLHRPSVPGPNRRGARCAVDIASRRRLRPTGESSQKRRLLVLVAIHSAKNVIECSDRLTDVRSLV